MNSSHIYYSIVIPTYNGAVCLPELIGRLARVMDSIDKAYEIILIDDDSPDNTWDVIKTLKKSHPSLRAFCLVKNVGQFRALMCGLEKVRGEYVITMDDDLQNPPEEIPKLINGMKQHPQMDGIIAAYSGRNHSFWRRMGSRAVRTINRLISNKPPHLQTTSFRLLRRIFVDAISAHRTMNPMMGPLVIQNSRYLMNVIVEHHPRKAGKSNYTFSGLVGLAMDHVLNYSTFPLKIVSVIGMVSSLLSIFLAMFYSIYFITTDISTSVKGWTTIVLLVTFFGGLTLFSIGLMGEYLIRIIREVSHGPRYIVREEL